jgi:hypothetical protein
MNQSRLKRSLQSSRPAVYLSNESTGKLFLLGHVLNNVEKQELTYTLKGLTFITSIDDNVVIDEYVWQNMNALLLSNPNWQMVSIHSPTPGKSSYERIRGDRRTRPRASLSISTSTSLILIGFKTLLL